MSRVQELENPKADVTEIDAPGVDLQSTVEIDGVTFTFSGPGNWVSETVSELGGATVFKSLSPDTSPNRSYMTAEIVGPAIIEYYAVQRWSTYDLGGLYVNDAPIDRYYPHSGWTKYSFQIEEGTHKVEFVIDDFSFFEAGESPVQYAGIHIVFGYQVQVDYRGGTLSISPQKSSYQKGDSISLLVSPIEGNRFIGWSGSISSDSASINHTVDSHLNLEARFEVENLGFGDNLRISNGVQVFWQTDFVNNETRALMAIANEGTKEFWFEVDVFNAGRISWDVVYETDAYSNQDAKWLVINGKDEVGFSRWFHEFDDSFLSGINPGRSTLRWRSENTYLHGTTAYSMILENIRYEPANDNSYELWMESLGLDPRIDGDPSDDPNFDGFPNILHYAFNIPSIGSYSQEPYSRITIITVEGKDYLTFTLPVHVDLEFFPVEEQEFLIELIYGFEMRIEASIDLIDYSLVDVELLEPALSESLVELPSEYRYQTYIVTEPVAPDVAVFIRTSVSDAR